MNVRRVSLSALFVLLLMVPTVLGAIPLTIQTPVGIVSTEVSEAEARQPRLRTSGDFQFYILTSREARNMFGSRSQGSGAYVVGVTSGTRTARLPQTLGGETVVFAQFARGDRLRSLNTSRATGLRYLRVDNFRGRISSLDVRNNTRLRVLVVQNTDVRNVNTNNLRRLDWLELRDNSRLNRVDVRRNTRLTGLYVNRSAVRNINLRENTRLARLEIGRSRISNLDLRNNRRLSGILIEGTRINSLNLRNQERLRAATISGNSRLTTLDVRRNARLQHLNVSDNRLTSIRLRNNSALRSLGICNNRLESLNVSRQRNLRSLSFSGNRGLRVNVSNNTRLTWIFYSPANEKVNPAFTSFRELRASGSNMRLQNR